MSELVLDRLEVLPGGSIIQHGPYNDRIYLMKQGEDKSLAADLIAMAKQHGYSKIFVKIPAGSSGQFAGVGYVEEAAIPRFYNDSETGIFMGYYLSEARSFEINPASLDKILHLAHDKAETPIRPLNESEFTLRQCQVSDVEEMAAIYGALFTTYPFPIHEPSFLLDTMQKNVDYFGIERNGKFIALSSAEIDRSAQNVEMTDFATLPEYRGNSLAVHLLRRMEKEVARKGIKTSYTIARAVSASMNITFAKLGYSYGGRLKNNTNISGKIDSMTIWYKFISD
ncbi:MAG: putative beta-lysine N-acetyltransferase [Desulfobulbaceae bacterium]|uniref:Putative beta-lysine N-acetyltransferase n=1 Tax=Candidatus Desulfatifera sulfidica TaxID=2841691 RepID=A0A8J6N7P5_9BACT|nr:putative beta-lysine N-acetyltransferase [Candidatus Desulfatifera sulfidica]